MKTVTFLLLSFFALQQSVAQEKFDSLRNNLKVRDSIGIATYAKVNSIQKGFNYEVDSLRNRYKYSFDTIDSLEKSIGSRIDSLRSLSVPTQKLENRLDSLKQKKLEYTGELTAEIDQVKAQAKSKLNSLDIPPELKGPVNEFSGKIDGYTLDSPSLPELSIPNYSLSDLGDLGIGESLKELTPAIPELDLPTDEIAKVSDDLKGYGKDVKAIADGNLNEVQQIPTALETKTAELSGADDILGKAGEMESVMGAQNPDAIKNEFIQEAKTIAIDHFAEKSSALKGTMSKLSKYKQKYSSISSLADLKSKPPNPMKSKSLRERLIPGIYFQFQQKNDYLIDINPYLGYRLTGRLDIGAGWNERIAYNSKNHLTNPSGRIYGPRVYAEYFLGRGFIGHIETEVLNTLVPNPFTKSTDNTNREWVWGMMTGIKREFKLYKMLKGTILLQYNLFNPNHKSPYIDRLNTRIGLEFGIKKKRKK